MLTLYHFHQQHLRILCSVSRTQIVSIFFRSMQHSTLAFIGAEQNALVLTGFYNLAVFRRGDYVPRISHTIGGSQITSIYGRGSHVKVFIDHFPHYTDSAVFLTLRKDADANQALYLKKIRIGENGQAQDLQAPVKYEK